MSRAINYQEWDWSTKNIVADIEKGEYVSSEATCLLAGPARLETVKDGTTELIPIGKTVSFDVRQSKQNQPIYEIGARRCYMMSDKQAVNGSFRSIMFSADSLLKLLYNKTYENETSGGEGLTWQNLLKTDKPGADNSAYWGAFSSRLFTSPIGIAAVFRTNRNRPYGGIYIEDLMLNDFSISIASTQGFMAEAAGFDASMVKALTLAAIPSTITAAGNVFGT